MIVVNVFISSKFSGVKWQQKAYHFNRIDTKVPKNSCKGTKKDYTLHYIDVFFEKKGDITYLPC